MISRGEHMDQFLPDTIERDDPAMGWSFTLHFLGTCVRKNQSPLAIQRASLLVAMMDVEVIRHAGVIMRPYERYREIDGQCELWSMDQFLSGKWPVFHQLFDVTDGALVLRTESQWMLDSLDYSQPGALRGSTSGLSDEIIANNLSHWLTLSSTELANSIRAYLGSFSEQWQSYNDLIPTMPGADDILREHLVSTWSDRVAVDAVFRRL